MMYRTLPPPLPSRARIHFILEPHRLVVPWAEVARILGRQYALASEDDDLVYAALELSGCPAWVRFAGGSVETEGWVLVRPKGL